MEWKPIETAPKDGRMVEIVCSICQAKESIYMAPRTLRLYWMEETKVYQNACPDCHTAYTLQAQPYDGEA